MNLIISISTYYELALASILLVTFLIQLFYYFGFFIKIPLYKKPVSSENKKVIPLSVVICARDEEENLSKFLPTILEQDYPDFEVIVVNDCSSDNSELVLNKFVKEYSRLRVTTIKQDEKFSHNKKLALTVGIKAARYDWLVLTDADCKPETNQWLSTVASNFDDKTEIVLGYGGFFEEKGFLNRLIRFDGLFIAMHYLGFALSGKPYMGVGRNMAYRKELFFGNKGFASHAHLASGDDDLFINEVATSKNTRVEFRYDAHVRTIARKSFNRWVTQKSRHITTGSKYKFSSKFLLGSEIASRFLFYGSAITLAIMQFFPWVVLALFVARWLIQLSIIKAVMNRLNEKKILLILLVYDFFSLFFYGAIAIINRFRANKSRWK